MIEIIQNYLPEATFNDITSRLDDLPWLISRKMNINSSSENHFAFIQDYSHHIFQKSHLKGFADSFNKVVMAPYAKKHNLKNLKIYRSRTNMYIKTTDNSQECGYHQDQTIPNVKTLLLYLEDSDGFTQFKTTGEKISSERNKAIIFNSNIEHQTVSQTNTLFRHNININFGADF